MAGRKDDENIRSPSKRAERLEIVYIRREKRRNPATDEQACMVASHTLDVFLNG